MNIILADNQDITRIGLQALCSSFSEAEVIMVSDKAGLIDILKRDAQPSVVVLDYILFDINDIDELQILSLRFPQVQWILFSSELTNDFVRTIVAVSNSFSVLLKESSLDEIRDCLRFAIRHQRYICQRITDLLLAPVEKNDEERIKLTRTEIEILKDIALGMTTKEIAEKRISSFHTVNTHRKNIFRKLGVNNAHEATKYALRAGLVDSAEYYI